MKVHRGNQETQETVTGLSTPISFSKWVHSPLNGVLQLCDRWFPGPGQYYV